MTLIRNARDDALALLEDLLEQDVKLPLSSGLPVLDEALSGGIRPGLSLLGGGPGVGKTAFVLQFMLRSGLVSPAVLFSAEQSTGDLLARLLAAEIGRPVTALLDGDPQAIADAFEAIDRLPLTQIYVVADARKSAGSIDAIRKAVEAVSESCGRSPLVAVDYLQRLRLGDDDQPGDARSTVARNSESLTDYVRENRLTALVISSINRASYKAEPSLDVFKESGNLEFDADLAMVLRRRSETGDEVGRGHSSSIVELWIVKNRVGQVPPGPLVLHFDGRLGSFSSAERS